MSFHVVGVGEVLWDILPAGAQLGGAPANFAYHAHALGARVEVITRVGRDDYGRDIVRRFRAMGIPDETVQVDDSAATGTAKVELSDDGLPQFTIQKDVAWDSIALTAEAVAAARAADAICFGSLAQRSDISRNTIQQLVRTSNPEALRVFDVNLRQQFYSHAVIEESLRVANVAKLNDDEFPALAEMFDLTGSPREQLEHMAEMFGLQLIALTCGANGSLLYRNKQWSDCQSRPMKVVDTVGAGDSFTAALVMGMLHKFDLHEIHEIASDVAQFVCSRAGATPTLPTDFANRFLIKQH